jgi:hypothetical protein
MLNAMIIIIAVGAAISAFQLYAKRVTQGDTPEDHFNYKREIKNKL